MSDFIAENRFVRRFGLTTPTAAAPMALASGGALSAACARAGALGLLGGAYGEREWTAREYALSVDLLADSPEALARLGCGFITWRMGQDRSALDWLFDQPHIPAAIMLSFGDPRPIAGDITARGIALICQVQTLAQVPEAVEAGASVIVAQGGEAGGHGMKAADGRSTFTLVPEIADWLAANAPEVMLLAAGGVADGRGLAAAMMLGADGGLVGSRLWASEESLAPDAAIERAKKDSMPKDNIDSSVAIGSCAGGTPIEEVLYEGYGPGGVALLIQAVTDNNNRTAAEIRSLFSKSGLELGTPGSAAWAFTKQNGEYVPTTLMELDDATGEKLAEFIEKLEDNDDVTNVYTTADSPEGE